MDLEHAQAVIFADDKMHIGDEELFIPEYIALNYHTDDCRWNGSSQFSNADLRGKGQSLMMMQ